MDAGQSQQSGVSGGRANTAAGGSEKPPSWGMVINGRASPANIHHAAPQLWRASDRSAGLCSRGRQELLTGYHTFTDPLAAGRLGTAPQSPAIHAAQIEGFQLEPMLLLLLGLLLLLLVVVVVCLFGWLVGCLLACLLVPIWVFFLISKQHIVQFNCYLIWFIKTMFK